MYVATHQDEAQYREVINYSNPLRAGKSWQECARVALQFYLESRVIPRPRFKVFWSEDNESHRTLTPLGVGPRNYRHLEDMRVACKFLIP